MDFVLTLLSARNHDLMPSLKDVSVHAGACATYDLTREAAEHLGLPETACHPQDLTHQLGISFMAARGAELAGEVGLPAERTPPGSRPPPQRAPPPGAGRQERGRGG